MNPGAYMEQNCGTYSQTPWPENICYAYPMPTSLMDEQREKYPQDFEDIKADVPQDPGRGTPLEVGDRKGPGWEATGAVIAEEGRAGAAMGLDIKQGFHQDTNGDNIVSRFFEHGQFNASAAKLSESSRAVTEAYEKRQAMLANDLGEMAATILVARKKADPDTQPLYDESLAALGIYKTIAENRAAMLGIAACQLKVMDAVDILRQRLMTSANPIRTSSATASDTTSDLDPPSASDITGFDEGPRRAIASRHSDTSVSTSTAVTQATQTDTNTIHLGNESISKPYPGPAASATVRGAEDETLFVRVHRRIEVKERNGEVFYDNAGAAPDDFLQLLR